MAEFKKGAFAPGTYVKGDVQRVANTPREAVRLVFDGFLPVEPVLQPETSVPVVDLGKVDENGLLPLENEEQRIDREALEAEADEQAAKGHTVVIPSPADLAKTQKDKK